MTYTYILECADGSLYTGWTDHLEKRVEAHNAGRGAKYTRSRRPVRLVYYEEYATAHDAMRREALIKRLPRVQKLALIAAGNMTEMPQEKE
ncbi:MAG: GIY-YIG nuclease family protein [Selenomonadaceae bacterium]|nr:GIY-YIG nuclease family protein [Selenomonadaceae bacterium]MDY2684818.1 GIY-YIG nuclease family protein [Selenomonadaceae bacterium]